MSSTTFEALGLSASLCNALTQIGYQTPTPIQQATIPFALQDQDVLGASKTGSGKTAAFILPLLDKLIKDPKAAALILTPTRELATQIMRFANSLLTAHTTHPLRSVLLIGGQPIGTQLRKLQAGARLIIGTPGRVKDHLGRGNFDPKHVQILVLDETDRMLDMGFAPEMEAIIATLPKAHQTLLFSATFPKHIMRLAHRYLKKDAQEVSIDAVEKPSENVAQDAIYIPSPAGKYEALLQELDNRQDTILIFVKTKRGTEALARKLYNKQYNVDFIHGDLTQRRRDRVIKATRNRRIRILVATDVVARGLDIPHIQHVLNYDLPQTLEDYIHRIGRTGRGTATGNALSFVTALDRKAWRAIATHANPTNKSIFPAGTPDFARDDRKRRNRRPRFSQRKGFVAQMR